MLITMPLKLAASSHGIAIWKRCSTCSLGVYSIGHCPNHCIKNSFFGEDCNHKGSFHIFKCGPWEGWASWTLNPKSHTLGKSASACVIANVNHLRLTQPDSLQPSFVKWWSVGHASSSCSPNIHAWDPKTYYILVQWTGREEWWCQKVVIRGWLRRYLDLDLSKVIVLRLVYFLHHHSIAESSLSLPGGRLMLSGAKWDWVLAKWPLQTQPCAQGRSCDQRWSRKAQGHSMSSWHGPRTSHVIMAWPKSKKVQSWCWRARLDLVWLYALTMCMHMLSRAYWSRGISIILQSWEGEGR